MYAEANREVTEMIASWFVRLQFSRFDNPGNAASPIRRFSCRSWAPLVGDGDDIITELA